MAIANAPSDAEIAKKLQLKPGEEIIRKNVSDAIKLRPNYVTNYVNRAKAYRLMGNIKLAQDDDAKIMTLPKSSGSYTDLRREFAAPKPGGDTAGTARPPSKAD
jgi:hypothetical protein